MAESVGDFLEKVSAPRKPLTDQEKKEAMEVASEIRKKAKDIAGGKGKVSVVNTMGTNPNVRQAMTIVSNGEVSSNSGVELLIAIASSAPKDPGEFYYFTSTGVKKTVGNGQAAKTFYPDKADLSDLLANLSSAEIV